MSQMDSERPHEELEVSSLPYSEELGEELAVSPKYLKHFLRYPYRVFTDSSNDPTGGERTIESDDSAQIATLLYLESKLANWTLPKLRRRPGQEFNLEMSQTIENSLRIFLDDVDPNLTTFDPDLYKEYANALRMTLGYVFSAFVQDKHLTSYLSAENLSLQDVRLDMFLTFLSKARVREKIAEVLGFKWLEKELEGYKKDHPSEVPLAVHPQLTQHVVDEIHSRIICLIEGARGIPALARMIHMNADDHQLLKGKMACMGKASGMYIVVHRPSRQLEKHEIIESPRGIRITKKVVQPLHDEIEDRQSVGVISLKNLPEKSCVVVNVPVNLIPTFSLQDIFFDYETDKISLQGTRIKIVMIDEPDFEDEDLFVSAGALEEADNFEYDGISVREIPGPESYFTIRNVERLKDVEYRYFETPWFKELSSSDFFAEEDISVTELDMESVKGLDVIVDLDSHGIYMGDTSGELMLLERLEDII